MKEIGIVALGAVSGYIMAKMDQLPHELLNFSCEHYEEFANVIYF